MSLNHQKETLISNKNTIETSTSWGLDSTSLNNWLENDVKNYHIHDTNSHSKCSLKHIVSENNQTPILQYVEPKNINNNDPLVYEQNTIDNTTNMIPVIKVYSLLNSIRQNEQINKDKQHNKQRLIYPSPSLPSPVLSVTNTIIPKRKRGNNRPPVDITVKRQRNTDAARRSRLRKAIKMETFENRVETLTTENERLRVKVAVLETEVSHVAEKEQLNRQRVLDLEAQLAMAHKRLVEGYQTNEK